MWFLLSALALASPWDIAFEHEALRMAEYPEPAGTAVLHADQPEAASALCRVMSSNRIPEDSPH
jgi:hypothetical protein